MLGQKLCDPSETGVRQLGEDGGGAGQHPKKFFFRYLSALTNESMACGGSDEQSDARRE